MSYSIVPASEALLAEIEVWLDDEEAAYVLALNAWYDADCEGPKPVRGFRCNWDTAKKRWCDGVDQIDVLVVESEATGFLCSTDILEIRPDLRGKGYGRIMAQFMLDRLFAEGHSVAEIGIAPPSAKPFWISMGFTPVDDRPNRGAGIYAYKVLARRFELSQGPRVPYSIDFFANKNRYLTPPQPFATFSGEGELISDGLLQLPERIVCLNPLLDQHVDYYARVIVDGQEVIFSKITYEEAIASGFKRDRGYNYYIDVIEMRGGKNDRS